MKKRIKYGRWTSFVFLLLLLSFSSPMTAFAHERPEVTKKVSVTFSTGMEGVSFRLYRVAKLTDEVQFETAAPFDRYAVDLDLNKMNDESWKSAAAAYAGYAERDAVAAKARGITGRDGKLLLEGLESGLYLAVADRLETKDFIYEFMPFMICLPNLTADDRWDYDPQVVPKHEAKPVPGETAISLKVVKVWEDQGKESRRPEKITVQLLHNGKVHEEAVLNRDNNWRYRWKNLSSDGNWRVVEKEVPENYRTRVEKDGSTYVITNKYRQTETSKTPASTGGKLPQTGQLWWPVPLLAAGGVIFLSVGIMIKRRERK